MKIFYSIVYGNLFQSISVKPEKLAANYDIMMLYIHCKRERERKRETKRERETKRKRERQRERETETDRQSFKMFWLYPTTIYYVVRCTF